MSWTDRADDTPCCDGPLGPVGSGEVVARLLHSKIDDPDKAAFTRKELTGHGLDAPSNVCGLADGCSVDRAKDLDDDDLRTRSAAQAAEKAGRAARGALVANVVAIRAISHPDGKDGRAVFVYDDPRADNDRHAVIRICDKIPRTDFTEIRRALIAAFDRRVA